MDRFPPPPAPPSFSNGGFALPPAPPERNMAHDLSPEQLDALLAQGYTIYEDGSIAPPAGLGGDPGLMGAAPPPPPGIAGEAAMFSDPLFAQNMAVRGAAGPQAEVPDDPIQAMLKAQQRFLAPYTGQQRGRPGPTLGVPGGAGIRDGMPFAAPTPQPDYSQPPTPGGPQYGGRFGRRVAQRRGGY